MSGGRGRAVRVLRRGRARRARSIARSALLAAAFARPAAAAARRADRPRRGWRSGSASRCSAWLALAVAVLALARELGELRLAVRPAGRARDPRTRGRRSARAARWPTGSTNAAVRAGSRSPCSRPRAAGCAARWRRRSSASRATRWCVLRTFDEVPRRRRVGGRRTCPAARTRSRWAPTGRCSPRGRSTRRRQLESRAGRGRAADGGRRCLSATARAARRGRGGDARGAASSRASGEALMVAAGVRTVGALVAPGEAEAYHFCGHIYTTDSLPAPDRAAADRLQGLPAARAGRPAGRRPRPPDRRARAARWTSDGHAADRPRRPPAARRHAHAGLQRAVGERYGFRTQIDGSWYRCCGGHVRKLMDCCSLPPHAHQRRRAR